jgi:hypothetical protein
MMESAGINSKNIVNSVGIFNDSVDMNSIFDELYPDEQCFYVNNALGNTFPLECGGRPTYMKADLISTHIFKWQPKCMKHK